MDETVGEALRRLRKARGLSLRQLGQAVPVDFGLLSRIENNRQQASDSVIRAVDSALNADGQLVLLKAHEDSRRAPAPVPSEGVKRRTFVAGTIGAAAGNLLPGRAAAGGSLGASDVDHIQYRVVRLYAMDYKHGGESLWQAAVGYADEAYWWLDHGTFTDAVGQKLMEAAGRMQMCAGWLAFDAGRQDVARSCYNEALGLARQADDAEVETHALANLAFQANILGSPRQARRWAEAADRAAAKTDAYARLGAIPQLRFALASALTGERSDFEQAMTRARAILDSDADRPVERWCSFLTAVELDGVEGTGALEMGQTRRAVRLLTRAVDGHGDEYARTRALYRARLARGHLGAARDVEAAARAGIAALDDMVNAVASWRLNRELAAVATQLKPHRREPAAQEFLARHALLAKATPSERL